MKARLLKYLAFGLLFLVLGLIWAFSTFFFNPFEGSYDGDLATLIPRDVDFYLGKRALAGDFDPFPELAFQEELKADPAGQAFLQLEFVQELLPEEEIQSAMAALEESLAQLPVDVDPLAVFGGSELAVAGYFSGPELADADWAVYGRANWMGKLAVEGMHKGLANLEAQGLAVEELDDGFQLSGGELTRPLFFLRILDVVIVTTKPDLVGTALSLDQMRGQDSFWFSAKYQDHAAELDIEGDELNVYVNQRDLLEAQRKPGAWPDVSSEDLATRFLARLFQLGTVREHVLTVGFENGLTIDASGAISSELLSQTQKKLYRMRGFEKDEVADLASMVPDDVGMFVCGQGPLRDLLNELAPSLEPATLGLIEDVSRDVFGYADAYPLFGDLSTALGDRFAFFARNDDYPIDDSPLAPPRDDNTVLVWAVVFSIDDEEALDALRQNVSSNPSAFGIQGRDPSKGGIFTNKVGGGSTVWEYHSGGIPGTGHLATLQFTANSGNRYFLISNHHDLLGHAYQSYREQRPRLAEDAYFQTLLNTGLPQSDFVFWFHPRAIAQTMQKIGTQNAGYDIALAINWDVERPRIEKKVLKEHFPGERWGAVSPDNLEAFELMTQQEIDTFEREFTSQHLPTLRQQYTRPWVAAGLARATMLQLALDQKTYRLHGRVVVPFDGAAE